MKIRIVITFFALTYSLTLYAQKNILFTEIFENYTNDWKLVNTKEFKVKQEDGKLIISKATVNKVMNGCLWYKKSINNFDTSKDFILEFDAKSITSEFDVNFFDIQWGKIQEFDGVRKTSIYQLDFLNNRIRLAKFELGKSWTYYTWSTSLNDKTLSEFNIAREVFNRFEIRQEKGFLLVLVNNKLVYKIAIEYQKGSEIGFQQCLKGEWQIDNLIIKQ